ncbi:hypothetical protein N8310_05445 [Pseudomonadota bacterium]|nr:hypothetical protein [Pseudomonadota bacterium]
MFINFTKNDFKILFLFILASGIFARIFFYLYFGNDYLNLKGSKSSLLYLDAILNHSWEFLKNYHYKPIGLILKDIVIINFFENIRVINFLLISFFDVVATILLANILYIFGVKNKLTIITCFIFSLNLIGWEYWRTGNHFDHLNVFIFSFYIWSITRFIFKKNSLSYFFTGFSSILLILFYSLGYIIIPIITLLLLLFGRIKFKISFFIYVIFLPVLIIFLVLFKNFVSVGVISSSSLGGANTLQFSSYSEPHIDSFDGNTIIKMSKNIKMKEWWKWCLKQSFIHNPKAHVQGLIFGKCFIKVGNKIDFTDLKVKLKSLNETRLLRTVELDEELLKYKPWYFSNSNTLNFSVKYM